MEKHHKSTNSVLSSIYWIQMAAAAKYGVYKVLLQKSSNAHFCQKLSEAN